MADAKTVWDVLYVAVSPLITSIATITVAVLITRNMEKQRLKSQEDMEARSLAHQAESERQKQHMELYKAMYLERIAAANKLMERIGEITLTIMDHAKNEESKVSENAETGFISKEIQAGFARVGTVYATSRWLFTPQVEESFIGVLDVLAKYEAAYKKNADGVTIVKLNPELGSATRLLGKALSDMMLSDNLSRLMNSTPSPAANLP